MQENRLFSFLAALALAISLSQPANGVFLTREELGTAYLIIRHNVRTYQSAGVVQVLKGRHNAETILKKFEECQTSTDRHEGWRYFIEKTNLKPGTDPVQATTLRQADLESRESKALHEPTVLFARSA